MSVKYSPVPQFIIVLLVGLLFLYKDSLLDVNNESIYKNYDVGKHEWFLTNPKDSVDLFILEYGTGKDTVLVLHGGWGAEHRYLKDAFEGLYNDYHFIFYDQRGSLRSPCPKEMISMQNHISDIEAIRKEFGIKKLNLFAHSNGTTTATFYLKEYPDKVKGFIMAASVQLQQPISKKDSLLFRNSKKAEEIFKKFLQRPSIQQEINKIEQLKNLPDNKRETMKQRVRMASYYIYDITLWAKGKEPFGAFYSNDSASATFDSVRKMTKDGYDFRELYQSHPYPITIINGEYDMVDPGGKKFKYWTDSLPNVAHVLIDNAAHDSWIDRPNEFKKQFVKAMNKY